MLLKTDQESLCLTCHAGTGSALDVENGVSTVGGAALRGGGFTKSALNADNPTALYYASGTSVRLQTGVIPTLNVPVATTSSHGMGTTGAWGLGLSGAAAGTLSSPLECGSCHDPHGNGNYRLLQTVPGGVSNAAIAVSTIAVATNVATVTTGAEHYLGVGNTVTIAGAGAPYDGTWPVLATPTYTTFTFAVTTADATVTPAAATAKNAGQAVLDAPSATARVYTTTDYWKVNDETTPQITVGATTGVNSFIGSIAAWCTQCHTRYQTGRSATYANATGDPVFTYRHRANSVKATSAHTVNGVTYPNQVNTPNCIQCHVAHGSNATAVPNSLGVNFPGTSTVEDSALLRISNRGVCQMCHNK
jgi:hypothetical protein